MPWIDQFARSSFQIYAGNTIDAFQPIDFFHFYPLWYDLWLDNIDEALFKLDAYNRPVAEITSFLPGPSSLRAIIQKFIPSYRGFQNKNQEQMRRVINLFAAAIQERP